MHAYAILAMDPVVGCGLFCVKSVYLLQLHASLCIHHDGQLQCSDTDKLIAEDRIRLFVVLRPDGYLRLKRR